jgi:hypothetical protein
MTSNLPFGINQQFRTGNWLLDRIIGGISTSGFVTSIVGFPNYVQLGNAGYFYSVQPKGSSGTINGKSYGCPASNITLLLCVGIAFGLYVATGHRGSRNSSRSPTLRH